MEISKNNNILNQDLIEGPKTLKLKIYDYFHSMLELRKEPSFITLYILHSIEIIQLISFAFSPPHLLSWNISENNFKILSFCLSGFRLTPLLYFTSLAAYSLIIDFIFIIIVILFIFLIVQILFRKENSKIFAKFLSFNQMLILPLKVLFVIPLFELFLIAFKCNEETDYIRVLNWGKYKCWGSTHMFYIIVGVLGTIIFLLYITELNYYYFYPFFTDVSTTRLNSTVDQILILIKFAYIIQYVFIKDEYVSIAILLILSLLLIYSELRKPIYNSEHLEIFLNIRNIMSFWSYFMLLIAKICAKNENLNNIIYLMLFSYPFIIFGFIMFFKENESQKGLYGNNIKFNNVNSFLNNMKLLVKLINSFVKEHSKNINYRDNSYARDILVLKGIIEIHIKTCIREDCPLTKFVKNEGNYNVQKQALLSHMTSIFNKAMKTFPHDLLIRIYYIQFNYEHKYNLSSIKTTFDELRKLKTDNRTRFIIYCQEITITRMKLNSETETEEQEQNEKLLLEQSYQKMKKLISNITKLYSEFWGIFEAKVTNNLNLQKLYKLGERINLYLKELTNLWENDLKNKKLDFENEPVAQLYSMFLREILWDKKKSDLVQRKINEEHNLQEYNKAQDVNKNNFRLNSLEVQDYVIFVKADEKGRCTIIQFSNSLSYIFGYERHEILNKPFEILLPAIFKESYSKEMATFIKFSSTKKDIDEDNLKEIDKSNYLLLTKNKMGYINPFYIKCTICEDNDFSDSFLIRMKLESVDIKSMYAYYILARPDFSVESISSSAINLGLSMDLLKKYVIKLNVLVRTYLDKSFNLFEKFKEFENSEKKITWVYPDVIYPKDDNVKIKDKDIFDLIKESKKAKFVLQIIEIKNQSNEISGFIFKIYEAKKSKKEKLNKINEFIPSLKNQVIFDLLNLKYIRTVIVQKKSGFRNLREEDEENKNILEKSQNTVRSTRKKKEKKEKKEINEESSDEELQEMKITKEKLLELQTKDSNGIKYFINSLSFYGKEISLIKHRPNREKYPTGKAQEPLIKISLSEFTKRIGQRIKENPLMFKKVKSLIKENESDEKKVKIKLDQNNNVNQKQTKVEDKTEDIEEINKDLFGDNSLSLKNIVNISSLSRIKILGFIIYIFVIVFAIVEFIFSNQFFGDQRDRYKYLKYSYDLLNSIVYIKYFLMEGILTVNTENYSLAIRDKEGYIKNIKTELSNYHIQLSNIFSRFSSPDVVLSDKYKEFSTTVKVEMKTWNNGVEKIEYQPLQSAQTKLMNAIIYISNSAPDKNIFSLDDKYIYELSLNLLNSHYSNYERIISYMANDFKITSKSFGIKSIIIFSLSLFFSIAFLYIFWILMIRLDNDREKPVNLFLTIKNKVFEDLKNTSENFSNKLLNKFFGVDENEEESQQNYTTNVKPNDINITKFMALNEYKETNNKGNSFIFYYVQLVIFFAIFNFILIFKYIDSRLYHNNINEYVKIYNSTRFSEIYLMTRIDIMKQYLEDPITSYLKSDGRDNLSLFLYSFTAISEQIQLTIKETSITTSFLKDGYKIDFEKYFYHEFTKLINNNDPDMQEYSKYGFKTVTLEIFEMLRLLFTRYFMNNQRDINNKNISSLINNNKFLYLDVTIKTFFRPWYQNLVELFDSNFYTYIDRRINSFILLFIFMLILISIFYCIVWKKYEEEFINKIEKSFDLINLIPEEIKSIIVTKLNEAN